MSKPCPNLTLLPLSEAVQSLVTLLKPRLPDKLMHPHEKVSDAVLVALEVLRVLHKHPYRSVWFTLILLNFYPNLPSYTQIYTRLERLGHLIETWHQAPESVEIAVVDSFPLPVCRPKRAHSCKVRFASLGYGTQGVFMASRVTSGLLRRGESCSIDWTQPITMISRWPVNSTKAGRCLERPK